MRNRFLWAFILPSLYALALAQESAQNPKTAARISGKVVVAGAMEPIFAANVLLKGTMMGAASDTKGEYAIINVPPSTYTLKVSVIGYKAQERQIRVSPGEDIHVDFMLEETVLEMGGVAVTASRYQQSLEDIPISMNLIPARELSERNITTVDQALKYVPGVNSMEGGQITVRGSSGFNWGMGSRVLLLLNGHPMMSGDNWSISWYSFPSSTVKQIEVMKGSGSALYGSSAMGGVINIITAEPDVGNHISIRTHAGLYNKPSFSSWEWTSQQNHFEGTAADFSTHLGPVSMLLSTSYQATTGYKENDDSQIFNFMGNFSYHFSKNLRIDLLGGHGMKKGGFYVYWVDLAHPYANGADPYGYQTRANARHTFIFPSISYVMNNRIFVSFKATFHEMKTEDHLEKKFPDSPDISESFRSSTAKTRGLETQLNFQIFSHGVLVAGADFQGDEVEAIQYGHREISKVSYYMQYEQRLWGRLNGNIGARYDAEGGDDIESSSELSGKFGLNLTVMEGTHLRLSVGEGFRTPAIGERFVSTYTGGLRVDPNPSLQPERSLSGEIGLKQGITKSMNVDAAVFYSHYNNLIEPQLYNATDGGVVVRFANVEEARIIGLDMSYQSDWWSRLASTRLGYTYIRTEDLTPGEIPGTPLKYRPVHTLYFTNEMTFLPFTAGVDLRYLSKIERVDEYHAVYIKDIDKVVPTYVLSLRFGFVQKHYQVRLLVDNLLQYNYLSAPANLGAPRNASLQLTIQY